MRYSTEPKYRKYVKGYDFLSFARKFGDKYEKELMDTATKTEIDTAKTATKKVVQKTAEATRDLIGNKVADKITSVGKSKKEEKKQESRRNLHSTWKKAVNKWWLKIVLNIKSNFYCIKMEFQKVVNLLDTISNDKYLPRYQDWHKNSIKFLTSSL